MNMATTLMNEAGAILKDEPVSESLCEAGKALVGYCGEQYRLDPGNLSDLSFPDRVWMEICRQKPRLNFYPLAQFTERAVKKAILSLMSNPGVPEKGILQGFLGQFFFEVCIERLRRKNADEWNWSPGYHFSREGMKPPEEEKKLRRVLCDQCTALAQAFLPFLESAIALPDAKKARLEIRKGFRETLGMSLVTPKKTLEQHPDFVNLVVGNKLSGIDLTVGKWLLSAIKTSYSLSGRTHYLLFNHKHANVVLPYEELKNWVSRPSQSLVKDLVEIGVAVYMADLYTRRRHDLGRKIGLLMPVRHLEIWQAAKGELERAVSFLGWDDFTFHFVAHEEGAQTFVKAEKRLDTACVCLFSGGIDSTAGAIWALENGLCPIFVSHSSNHQVGSIQKNIMRRLYEIYDERLLGLRITADSITNLIKLKVPGSVITGLRGLLGRQYLCADEFSRALDTVLGPSDALKYRPVIMKYSRQVRHLDFYISKPRNTDLHPERIWRPLGNPAQTLMPQYLRTFLFLSLAAAVALEQGVDKIYLFENGPVAINPLFSEAMLNTRTSHPHFLEYFRQLIDKVFGVNMVIENPFLTLSKGEVAGMLALPKLKGLVSLTDSCWNWFRVPLMAKDKDFHWCRETHDGECIPCLVRRAAINHASLWPDDCRYLTDVFSEYPHLESGLVVALADYTRFCRNVKDFNDRDLLWLAPDLSVSAPGVDAGKLIAMIKKHAGEVLTCFQKRSNATFNKHFHDVLW